ncbi:hypothetical protein SHOU24_68 [Vibrio phage SHOU24]|uniref:hypothetical protein n=1 Tax=Vibrio phage SHOU24 TaxID=1414739 RepID=UPI0003ED25AC|nr:hypothetical protein SHOU24_68 [Vibrio phage SHOU24]AHI61265.1 hypothetical protein SHOU24_68 [Vibrio phage SHOU24]
MEREQRGARLSKSADADKVEPFCILKADGTFEVSPSLYARLDVVDRFLPNFHKPLQRRMLFTKPADTLPASMVIRHHLTQEVYIIGQGRTDTDAVEVYERMNVVHSVSNESSAHTDVIKWAPADPQNVDDMLLVSKSIGKFYIAVEYLSSSNEKYSDREQSSRMAFYAAPSLLDEANELCEFEYNGKMHAIRQVFYDSGFASGTLIDTGQNIEDYKLIEPVTAYDPVSGVWDFMTNAKVSPFSASEGEYDGDINEGRYPGIDNQKVIYIKAQHRFSSKFRAGLIIEDKNGKTWRIDRVRSNKRSPDLQATISRISKPQIAATLEA